MTIHKTKMVPFNEIITMIFDFNLANGLEYKVIGKVNRRGHKIVYMQTQIESNELFDRLELAKDIIDDGSEEMEMPKWFAEWYKAYDAKLDKRFSNIESKINKIEKNQKSFETKINKIDKRLSNLELDVKELKIDMALIKSLPTIKKEIAKLN